MRILLTGSTGQVGYELARSLQGLGDIVAVDRSRMNLEDHQQIRTIIREVKPNLIVNPAAYTAVDKAENEPEIARAINAHAPAVMAEEAKKLGAAMIHYSTDYVFDGSKPTPYLETDSTNPINVYGQTKREGELAIAAAEIPHLILRTSWVYGMRGKNFLLTMLRLAKEREQLSVVNDQLGAPTWSRTVAEVTSMLLVQSMNPGWWKEHSGVYHLSSRGQTTWFGFTQEIVRRAEFDCRICPIASSEYPVPAARPVNSLMEASKLAELGIHLPRWDDALGLCLAP